MNPETLALLDGAVGSLREIASSLAGEPRYVALLAANAVATARREATVAARLEAASPTDAGAVRAGAHDDDAELYRRLLADAALRAWVSDPSSLTETERAAIGEHLR